MKRFFVSIVTIILLFVIYITLLDPIIFGKLLDRESPFAGIVEKFDNAFDFLKSDDSESSGGGNNGNNSNGQVSGSNSIDYVYYTQDKSVTGLTGACLLTSYAMVITNAGRYLGTSKEYGPIDVYLANNPDATSKSERRVLAYHYVIATGFNYTWGRSEKSFRNLSDSEKIKYVKERLKDNPWGVVLGGEYGSDGTHYIVARYNDSGKLVFDDPVKSKGANISDISGVYGINSWSKITSVITITPKLNSSGVWTDGKYEKCKKNSSTCHVCATNVDC